MQIGRRDGGAPVTTAIYGAGIGFAAQSHGNGLPWRGDAGRTRDGLWLTRFRAVQNAIAKRRVQRGFWQAMGKYAQVVAVADRVTGQIGGSDGHGRVAIGQQRQIGGRHGDAPGAIRQRGAGVGFTVQGQGNRGADRQIGAATVDGQRQLAFRQVEFVIARDHGDRQTAEIGIDGHVMIGSCRVTGAVADGGGNGGLAVGQQRQVGSRNAGAPGTIGQHGRRVGFTVQRNGHDLARFHMGGGAGQGLSSFDFRAVDNVVTGKYTDADGRQVGRVGIDADAVGDAGAVACGVGEDCHQVVATVAERLQIGSGHAGVPRAIRLHHSGVGFAVQGQGDGATCIRDRGSAGDALCHQHFGGVQHIIASNQAHGEGRRGGINGDGGIQRIAVTRGVSNRDGQSWRAVWQRLQIGRRNADAPVAAAVHGAGIGFTAQGDGDGLAWCGDAGRARDGLRLARFCAIQDAVAKRRVQRGGRQAMDKHAQIVAAANRVTG
ncbi:hypothetical protein D3C79_618390 [compost metagenome]